MNLNIICVGKAHDAHFVTSIGEYKKRLKSFGVTLNWRIIPSQDHAVVDSQKSAESQNLLKAVGKDDFVILLDENGVQLDNTQLAAQLEKLRDQSQTITFIIGGAYGVDEQLRRRAQLIVSLSKLVFPHQLVRLILAEQLYRSYAIINGRKYHH